MLAASGTSSAAGCRVFVMAQRSAAPGRRSAFQRGAAEPGRQVRFSDEVSISEVEVVDDAIFKPVRRRSKKVAVRPKPRHADDDAALFSLGEA